MGKEIKAIDPRGYRVTCSSYYWDTHVLKYHPDLADHEDDAKRAIETSRVIYASNSKPYRHIYYGRLTGRRPEIKVVVSFDSNNVGVVVSVTASSRRPAGEKRVWP